MTLRAVLLCNCDSLQPNKHYVGSFHDAECCQRTESKYCCWWGDSRLGVVVVGVHIDIPQAQLVQLPNDFLHSVEVLVLHPIQRAGTRVGTRGLWIGEVEQSRSTSRNNLVLVCGVQRAIPGRYHTRCHTRYGNAKHCIACVHWCMFWSGYTFLQGNKQRCYTRSGDPEHSACCVCSKSICHNMQ